MDVSDHPLPTPPSIPQDSFDRMPSPPRRTAENPLSASPDSSHHPVVDAVTSDVRDKPPPPDTPLFSSHYSVGIARADSSIEFGRSPSEPPVVMEVDEPQQNLTTSEMVNGHKENGDYTVNNKFSGSVESPQPTTIELTPPSTSL